MQQQTRPVAAANVVATEDSSVAAESRLTKVLSGLLAGLLGLLTAGLLAAMAGAHHWFVVGPLAVLMAAGLYRLLPQRHAIPPLSRAAALALVILVAGAVVSAVTLRSNLVVAGRDGATYANTAAFLVEGADLFPQAVAPPFDIDDELSFGAPGFVVRDDGTMWQQFLHSVPAAMGFVGELFGRGAMFSFNPLVSGIGILGLFALGRRFMSEWWALAATAVITVSLPFAYYSRGSFAEVATLTLVAGGLWVAHGALTGQPQLALGAGLLLGGSAMVRVDGWMIAVALVVYLLMTTWLDEPQEQWVARRMFTGYAITGFIGLVDIAVFSQPYLTILSRTLIPLLGLLVLLRLLEPIVASQAMRSLGARVAARPHRAGSVLVIIGTAIVVYLWFVRPIVAPTRLPSPYTTYGLESIQIREGIPVDGSRTYFDQSVWWLTWYIGVPLTALGFAGLLGSLRLTFARGKAATRLITLAFAVPTLIYLLRPTVNPDQIWAIRRFLPVILPGLVLYGFAAVAHLFGRYQPGSRTRALLVAVAAAATLPVLLISAPMFGESDRAGVEAQFAQLCNELAGVDSVLVINDDPEIPLSGLIGPPLRSWCGLSVAGGEPAMAGATAAEAVIAARPELLPGAAGLEYVLEAQSWERRLTTAPRATTIRSVQLFIGLAGG